MNASFQLALELSSVFPIREGVLTAAQYILKLARELRKSGSDLVVEEDLAEVFGRGKVSSELETKFKDATKIANIVPLGGSGEMALESGPGPTLQNAFRDNRYLASVIQLSFLSWMHNREVLASMLSQAMRKRYELNVAGAAPDPGFEGISKTLAAISSQTSTFCWSYYVGLVEEKLREAIPMYAFSSDYIKLSASLLLGAMDYLFLVQSLPENRKVTVSNESGSITLVIWAHFILGLDVLLKLPSDKTIVFGSPSDPQVIIVWTSDTKEDAHQLFWPGATEDEEPTIRYHDCDMVVILESSPDPEHRPFQGSSEDRHPVMNYGVTYLRRLFNASFITQDTDPIYEESVKLITALAINANSRFNRTSTNQRGPVDRNLLENSLLPMRVEVWRILDAAALLFADIGVDAAGVDSYVDFLSETKLDEKACPSSFNPFLRKVKIGESSFSPAKRLLDQVQHLARIVLLFAHVVDVQGCADMPIRITDDLVHLSSAMSAICKDPKKTVMVESSEIFHGLVALLDSDFDNRDDSPRFSSRHFFLSLCSDFGWSIFFDTVGDKDPSDCKPELIHVQPGTPTNAKTGERKFKIRDGGGVRIKLYPDVYPVKRGPTYLPRTSATVLLRREYWTALVQEFQSHVYYSIDPSPEWQRSFTEPVSTIDEISTYRAMHDSLWEVHLTQPCEHPKPVRVDEEVKLGPDAAALVGWNTAGEILGPWPERVLILLTRSDPRLRWLAVIDNTRTVRDDRMYRSCMLRTSKCCEECALMQATERQGRWVLIL